MQSIADNKNKIMRKFENDWKELSNFDLQKLKFSTVNNTLNNMHYINIEQMQEA